MSIHMLPAKALNVCLLVHEGQRRKDGRTPYAGHPIRVALKLQDLGCPVSIVEAALLHDTVEDQPERITMADIANAFEPTTVHIVNQMTKTKDMTRKEYINSFRTAAPETCVVKLADRLDNLKDDFSWDPEYQVAYADEALRLIAAIMGNDRVRERIKSDMPVGAWIQKLVTELETTITVVQA